jgi:hypothetical protein
MEAMDYWRLCDQLTVKQSAMLVVGCDPSEVSESSGPQGYEAAMNAIANALRGGKVDGQICPRYEYDFKGDHQVAIKDSIDINESRVEVESLRRWLASRGLASGFFFPMGADAPGYLDPDNSHYAPKLAAAIAAWQAITSDPELTNGTSVKQAMLRWLRKHADQFGLTKDDGNPNCPASSPLRRNGGVEERRISGSS